MSDDEQTEHCSPANAELENRSLLAAIADDLRQSWKVLFLTDVTYKLIAFVVLTPVICLCRYGWTNPSRRQSAP